jgi:hypothetical protein
MNIAQSQIQIDRHKDLLNHENSDYKKTAAFDMDGRKAVLSWNEIIIPYKPIENIDEGLKPQSYQCML